MLLSLCSVSSESSCLCSRALSSLLPVRPPVAPPGSSSERAGECRRGADRRSERRRPQASIRRLDRITGTETGSQRWVGHLLASTRARSNGIHAPPIADGWRLFAAQLMSARWLPMPRNPLEFGPSRNPTECAAQRRLDWTVAALSTGKRARLKRTGGGTNTGAKPQAHAIVAQAHGSVSLGPL